MFSTKVNPVGLPTTGTLFMGAEFKLAQPFFTVRLRNNAAVFLLHTDIAVGTNAGENQVFRNSYYQIA